MCPTRIWIFDDEAAPTQQPEATEIDQGTLDSAASDSDSSEECPTCFDSYTDENPKITAECSHHFHLPCILEWQQRSEECPNCRRVLIINKTFDR
ncbi:E3 ubiquitin-protein ligase At3g02290-like [Prosopis cineraria]|uniref:E3 ubiquitin-protein ligase At3g02290-like n=1 Tax=Prosopis cineraria TaxID=364024 RepID=UPI00240F2486|nr:E3 ubiquitin-protein ligase At3g02290-like [Prosopis cineraria]